MMKMQGAGYLRVPCLEEFERKMNDGERVMTIESNKKIKILKHKNNLKHA